MDEYTQKVRRYHIQDGDVLSGCTEHSLSQLKNSTEFDVIILGSNKPSKTFRNIFKRILFYIKKERTYYDITVKKRQ